MATFSIMFKYKIKIYGFIHIIAYSKVTFDLFIHVFVFQSISPSWWLPVKEFAQRIIKVMYIYTHVCTCILYVFIYSS